MEKTIFEPIGGTYTVQGDYYLPNLVLPAEGNKPIGIWGQRHKRYLQEHKRAGGRDVFSARKANVRA